MEKKELKERFVDEKTGIEYIRHGDYYIPNLVLPKQKKIHLNKYGRMRLNYLEEIQETATKRIDLIIDDLKAKSNLTEDMKNTDMLYWIGTMNTIKQQAEEIILKELIHV